MQWAGTNVREPENMLNEAERTNRLSMHTGGQTSGSAFCKASTVNSSYFFCFTSATVVEEAQKF